MKAHKFSKWRRRTAVSFNAFTRHLLSSSCDNNIHLVAFTARRTIVHSAVLRLHVVRLSVCDVGVSGSHRLEILETKLHGQLDQHLRSPYPKGHPPTPRGTWGNLGETRGGVACWRTKAAISLKHVEIDEKLLWRAYRKSPCLLYTSPSPRD